MKQSSVDLTRDTIKNLEASNRKLREQIRLLRNDLAAQAIRLKDSEVRFRSILENTSIPLFTFNAEGKILIWNKALEELLGMSGEDIKETNLLKTITKRNEIQRIEGIIETVFNGKGVTDIEGEITTASEKVRHLSISMLPVRGTAGTVTFGSAIVVDITEKKQLEQALLQTEKMAAMGTLASGLAHEVGTPMNVILGRAESLLLHTNEEKTAKGLMIIIEQIDRMTRLIQHLLAFAREEPIEKKRLRINQIIKKGVEFIEQQAAAK
ncbi:MAG: PAS domain S-box protein, partial [Nitrospiria bacterium]